MKSMTATDARKHWFRLLDEVAEGEEVLIERDGARLVLRLAEPRGLLPIPDYRGLIQVPDVQDADQWSWDWDGSPGGLKPRSAGFEP
jgi:hypothetical protein